MAHVTFSQGSGLQDSIYGNSQAPVRMLIESKAEEWENKSVLPEVFWMTPSGKWAEKFTTLTAMEGFQPVGENGAYPIDGMEEGFSKTLEHVVWKDAFSISREIIDDTDCIDLKRKPTQFTVGYYRTRELFGASLIGGAIAGTGAVKFRGWDFSTKTADGKNLFHTEHPAKVKGAKQSNLFADAFSKRSLAKVEAAMQDFRGDNQEILAVHPNTIVIPNDADLKDEVFSVIGADKDPSTANNGFNFIFGRWRVVVWQYLNQFISSGAKPWIVLDSDYNEEYGGAIWLDRVKLEVKSVVDDNDANRWKGYARFTAGFNDWRAFSCAGVAGGTQLITG